MTPAARERERGGGALAALHIDDGFTAVALPCKRASLLPRGNESRHYKTLLFMVNYEAIAYAPGEIVHYAPGVITLSSRFSSAVRLSWELPLFDNSSATFILD